MTLSIYHYQYIISYQNKILTYQRWSTLGDLHFQLGAHSGGLVLWHTTLDTLWLCDRVMSGSFENVCSWFSYPVQKISTNSLSFAALLYSLSRYFPCSRKQLNYAGIAHAYVGGGKFEPHPLLQTMDNTLLTWIWWVANYCNICKFHSQHSSNCHYHIV